MFYVKLNRFSSYTNPRINYSSLSAKHQSGLNYKIGYKHDEKRFYI